MCKWNRITPYVKILLYCSCDCLFRAISAFWCRPHVNPDATELLCPRTGKRRSSRQAVLRLPTSSTRASWIQLHTRRKYLEHTFYSCSDQQKGTVGRKVGTTKLVHRRPISLFRVFYSLTHVNSGAVNFTQACPQWHALSELPRRSGKLSAAGYFKSVGPAASERKLSLSLYCIAIY